MATKTRFLSGRYWSETSDHDPLILNELERLKLRKHYRPSHSDWLTTRNQRMLLRYLTGQGILFWKRKPFLAGQSGIKCVMFINNSEKPSQELLQDAVDIARTFWLETPLFVHINPKLFPKDAEKIFQRCGWKSQGLSEEGFPIYFCDNIP